MSRRHHNPYESPSLANEPETEVRTSDRSAPIESSIAAAIIAEMVFLFLPATGSVRFNDAGWAWLDPWRLPPPYHLGIAVYIVATLGASLTIGAFIAGFHVAMLWVHKGPRWARFVARIALVVAILVGISLPVFVYRFERMILDDSGAIRRPAELKE